MMPLMGNGTEKFVDVPGGYLYCRTRGEGPEVVLLNAGAADLRMWESTVDWLAGIARVTTFDYLGSELDPPVKHRFGELTVPVSVVVGERDFKGTQLWARRLANEAPHASLEVLPGADHFPMFSAP